MSKRILEEIIKDMVENDGEPFNRIEGLEKKAPWFYQIMEDFSDKMLETRTQVSVIYDRFNEYIVKITGFLPVIEGILDAADKRYNGFKYVRHEDTSFTLRATVIFRL